MKCLIYFFPAISFPPFLAAFYVVLPAVGDVLRVLGHSAHPLRVRHSASARRPQNLEEAVVVVVVAAAALVVVTVNVLTLFLF